MIKASIVAVIAVVLVGCSGQQQSPSAPSGASQTSAESKPAINGCTLDLTQICQAFIDQPEFPMNERVMTWQEYSANQFPHSEFLLPASALDSHFTGEVHCFVDQHRKITRAVMMSEPDGETLAHLKQDGWCAEQSPNYDQQMAASFAKILKRLQ